jgi:hypothetical protein
MEALLNLLWLMIAVAATARFAITAQRDRDDISCPGRRRLAGTALVCVIALLFPIISVTDDLHEDAALIEETSAARRVSAGAQPRIRVTSGLAPSCGLLPGGMHRVTLVPLWWVDALPRRSYAAPAAEVSDARGPPRGC